MARLVLKLLLGAVTLLGLFHVAVCFETASCRSYRVVIVSWRSYSVVTAS